ncbi:MAG: hypothetical protein ACO3UU_17640 [Minisyncoccia bacterium]
MENEKEKIAQSVYDMLMSQDFAVWYENHFMDHVYGELGAKSRKEICEDIAKLLP